MCCKHSIKHTKEIQHARVLAVSNLQQFTSALLVVMAVYFPSAVKVMWHLENVPNTEPLYRWTAAQYKQLYWSSQCPNDPLTIYQHRWVAKDTSEREDNHHLRTWKGFKMFGTLQRRGGNVRIVGCVVTGHQEVLGILPSSNVLLAATSLHCAHHHALNSTAHKETCLAKHHTLHHK